jgi:hypothetical protein
LPDCVTVIDWVVAPLDQTFPVAALEVRTTDPPLQKVIALAAVIVGVVGTGFTVTLTEEELPDEQPFELTSTE